MWFPAGPPRRRTVEYVTAVVRRLTLESGREITSLRLEKPTTLPLVAHTPQPYTQQLGGRDGSIPSPHKSSDTPSALRAPSGADLPGPSRHANQPRRKHTKWYHWVRPWELRGISALGSHSSAGDDGKQETTDQTAKASALLPETAAAWGASIADDGRGSGSRLPSQPRPVWGSANAQRGDQMALAGVAARLCLWHFRQVSRRLGPQNILHVRVCGCCFLTCTRLFRAETCRQCYQSEGNTASIVALP